MAVVVVLVASGLVVLYGLILDRSGQNIAFTVAGLAVLGLTLAFISAWFLTRALTDARWGRDYGERPRFNRPDQDDHPDDPYTPASVQAALQALLRQLG